ncbi:MAG: hypothetical protein GC161_02700 [Planctomycetaceae bacterium]|nr:hypothetical protein [Planctomycetaceae bacterium]
MIALVRFEFWRTFWAGLVLTLVFGAPLFTEHNTTVLALLYDEKSSTNLLRLAVAMPFLIAVLQFGIDRWMGLMPVLLHRGTAARKIQAAKTIVGLGWALFFLGGVLALELRMAIDAGQPRSEILEALWVVPQVVCLALLSWSAGELAVRGSKRGALVTGLCIGGAYLAVHGLHTWAQKLGAYLPLPFGLLAYCGAIGTAGALLWLHSHRTYGRADSVRLPSEPRVALLAAAALLCLWPNVDALRVQTARWMHMRLEPVQPNLEVDVTGNIYEMETHESLGMLRPLGGGEPIYKTRQELKAFTSPPVITYVGDMPVHLAEGKGFGLGERAPGHSFLAATRRLAVTRQQTLENPPWEALGAAFTDARRDRPVDVTAFLCYPSGELILRYTGHAQPRRQRGESSRVHVEVPTPRSDGRPFSLHIRQLDDRIVDEGDGTFWRLDPERLDAPLQPVPAPPGRFLAIESMHSRQTWMEKARFSFVDVHAITDAGHWRRVDDAWQPVESSGELATMEELKTIPLPLRLVAEPDVLGRHRSRLVDANGQVLVEYDTSRRSGSADRRRGALVAMRLLTPPATALVDVDAGLGRLDAGQGLPVWVRVVHLALGVLAAALAWRLQRGPIGRCTGAAAGLFLGPLFVLALHLSRGELDRAHRAGPRGHVALPPLFRDRSGEAESSPARAAA